MQKLLFTLFIIFLFISCKTQNKKNNITEKLPPNTSFFEIVPEIFIPKLPKNLDENSGIIIWDDLIWTHNDSGGKNVIYGVNFKGELKREVEIEDGKNVDWEDIAQDEKNIYIGDFGNNRGNRKKLVIYKIKKKDIRDKKTQKVNAKKIRFSYSDQDNFENNRKNSSYDCEAMIVFNEHLYLFTKDWANRRTAVYRLPTKKGEYEVSPAEEFDVGCLITGADISPDKNTLALVGYKNYKPVLWLFSGINENSFFGGKKVYAEMKSIFNAQTEGVCFKGNDTLLISCERTSSFTQQIFQINLNKLRE